MLLFRKSWAMWMVKLEADSTSLPSLFFDLLEFPSEKCSRRESLQYVGGLT